MYGILEVQDVELINPERLHWLHQLKNKNNTRFTGYSLIDIHLNLYQDPLLCQTCSSSIWLNSLIMSTSASIQRMWSLSEVPQERKKKGQVKVKWPLFCDFHYPETLSTIYSTHTHTHHSGFHPSACLRSPDACSVPRGTFLEELFFILRSSPIWPAEQIRDSTQVANGFGVSMSFDLDLRTGIMLHNESFVFFSFCKHILSLMDF